MDSLLPRKMILMKMIRIIVANHQVNYWNLTKLVPDGGGRSSLGHSLKIIWSIQEYWILNTSWPRKVSFHEYKDGQPHELTTVAKCWITDQAISSPYPIRSALKAEWARFRICMTYLFSIQEKNLRIWETMQASHFYTLHLNEIYFDLHWL